MTKTDQEKVVRQIVARVVEELGADAVLFSFTKTRRNQTSVFIHSHGNQFACRGLSEEMYNHYCDSDESENEQTGTGLDDG